MSSPGVVVVGAGQAAATLAMELRRRGYSAPVTIIGEQAHQPYQLPPLSKAYLAGEAGADVLPLRPDAFWRAKDIRLRSGDPVTRIERQARAVELSDRSRIPYDHLVLATGAQPRMPVLDGHPITGAHVLRTRDDADRLRSQLPTARHVVVLGAGFVGLEVAAIARAHGSSVTVLELAETAMARALSPRTAGYLVQQHRRRGVDVRLAAAITAVSHDQAGRISAVTTTDGDVLDCDLLIAGVGVTPRTELAKSAGLACNDGIIVDQTLRTTDEHISAIGDCALFPSPFGGGRHVRLEAVQNAIDQARCVAARLTGQAHDYHAVPWFWTYQYDVKVQIAGLVSWHDHTVVRGDIEDGSFSVFCYAADRLLGVESVNRPADHVLARALLAGHHQLTPDVVADPATDLNDYRPRRAATAAP